MLWLLLLLPAVWVFSVLWLGWMTGRYLWRRSGAPRRPRHDVSATDIARRVPPRLRGTSPGQREASGTPWTRPEAYVDAPEYLDRRDPDA